MPDNDFAILFKEVEKLAQELTLATDPLKRRDLVRRMRMLVARVESPAKNSSNTGSQPR